MCERGVKMLSTEQVFEVLPLISAIYEKIDLKSFAKEYYNKPKEDLSEIEVGIEFFNFIFKNMREIKEECLELVAIFEGKEIEEVRRQSFTVTLNSLKEIFTDKELLNFFKSAMQ